MTEPDDRETSRLERRLRWLLRAYPAAYRAAWGEEITGTLLDQTPAGRDWPVPRETAALLTAGLHARRTANLRPGLAASVRQIAVLGAALYLVQLPALDLGALAWAAPRGNLPYLLRFDEWLFYVVGGLALVLIAAAWSGRRWLVALTAAASVAAAVSCTVLQQDWRLVILLAIFVAPPAAVILAVTRRGQRLPAAQLWLPGLALAAAGLASFTGAYPALFAADTARSTLLSPYTSVYSLVVLLVAVCWLATDVRPLASLVLAFTGSRVVYGLVFAGSRDTVTPVVVALGIAVSVALAGVLVWLLRRRTRACPTAVS